MPAGPIPWRGVARNAEDYNAICGTMYPRHTVNLRMWEDWARQQQSGEVVLWFSLEGFFWHPRTVLGIERHLYAFYDQAGADAPHQ